MENTFEQLKIELDKLTRDQLDDVISFCERKKDELKRDAAAKLMSEIDDMLNAAGLDANFLIEKLSRQNRPRAGAAKAKGDPLYRNPQNHLETWTGRGRKPGWLREKEESGQSIEDFRI